MRGRIGVVVGAYRWRSDKGFAAGARWSCLLWRMRVGAGGLPEFFWVEEGCDEEEGYVV